MGALRNRSVADGGSEPRARVLVVDDDPDVTAVIRAHLTRLDGVTVETTSDPEAALGRVEEGRVDCVVSDYEMPGVDGLDVLESVRDRHGDVPFVLFTARGGERVRSRARERDATFVSKGRGGVQRVADHVADRVGPSDGCGD